MGKHQGWVVSSEVFKTKKELADRVRGILYAYREGETLNMFDFVFMEDLLQRHPSAVQKVGCGVASMYVQTNRIYGGNTRGFWLMRTDGSKTDFSFLECLSPSSQTKKVKSAFRTAIEPYTMHFKEEFFMGKVGRIDTCSITGETISFGNSHVDHKPPFTFEKIFNDFVDFHNIDINSIEIYGTTQDRVLQDELIDMDLRDKWVRFHNQHAVLRVISATANLSHVRYESRQIAEATL